MSEDRWIHDLLERAVRDHSPTTIDPEQAVVSRANRDRRRSVLLTAAATLVVVLGSAGVLNIVDTQTRGDGPAAGPAGRSAGWESGQPEDARGRAEAEARASAAAAAAAAAAEAEARNGYQISFVVDPVVTTPPGWTEYLADADVVELPADGACRNSPMTVYAHSLSLPGAGARPCNGAPVAPYIWMTSEIPLPSLGRPLTQELLVDGVPIWVQDSADSVGNPVVDVHFPGSRVMVRAAGLPVEELLGYLIAPHIASAPLEWYLRPPGDDDDVIDGSVTLLRGADVVLIENQADLRDLEAALRQLPSTGGDCVADGEQVRIDVQQGRVRTNHIVVDELAGCMTAVSSMGGTGQVTPEFLALLDRLLLAG